MNILITGGNGFIAKHITAYLAASHNIFAPNKNTLNCLDKVAVSKFFDTHNIDVVIHTALTGRENLFSSEHKYYDDALAMWNNIRNQRHKFKKLIHFGSAYDTMDTAYGLAKQTIAASCALTENFYNLRLFGSFHYSEKDTRFFKKLYNTTKFTISENKLFDYFNLEDVFPIIKFVINEVPTTQNFDLVYEHKRSLISQAMEFCVINEVKTVIEVQRNCPDFIGNHAILKSFNIKLAGLEEGFKKYEICRSITPYA